MHISKHFIATTKTGMAVIWEALFDQDNAKWVRLDIQ